MLAAAKAEVVAGRLTTSSPLVGGGNECAFLQGAGQATFNAANDPNNCYAKVVGMSPTNTNPSLTGKPAFKTGNRSMMFSVKYYF